MNKNSPKIRNSVINPGILYVVATPLGNRDDITLRALDSLRQVDLIAAEDTRKTGGFLTLHGIKNNLISYHEHNEAERTPALIAKLQKGVSMALVSNAGTPTVSDPGYRLIEAALENHLSVLPIPGVCAATAALSVAGLPTDSFIFAGFLAKKKAKRLRQLNELASEPRTLIFYESPRRILRLLNETIDVMGDRRAVLAREMTKLHEEFIRGRLSEIQKGLAGRNNIKGECTLLVAGNDRAQDQSWPMVRRQIEAAVLAGQNSLSAISREIAATSGIAKNKIYGEALRISKELDGG
ncbi:16S rRNA (cytidine(1402)-2'-O)-methyltransferase (EC [Olavius sp. associated proteobacterium Delta 1]|nr:16S rRNA (cytidine(1402)-2'-O)-methyltransferase (EC [Olavius sp. associated proteobacterium Delta 1]